MKQTRSPIRQMPEKDNIAVLGCTIFNALQPAGAAATGCRAIFFTFSRFYGAREKPAI